MNKLFYTALLFYCPFTLFFYCEKADAVESVTVNWELIDTSNSNLPENYITGITQDQNGAIWVSTYNGFAKYLGQNVWQTFHTPNITFNDVCLAIESQDSIIWVATVNGLVRYCNSQLTVYNSSNSNLQTSYIVSLGIESDVLWIGALDYGVYKYDGISFTNYSYNNTGNMPLGNIWSIAIDHLGTKWFSCADARIGAPNIGSVVSFDDVSWTLFDTSNSGLERFPRDIAIDSLNNKWITDLEGHLKKYDGNSWINFDTSNISPKAFFKSGKVAIDSIGNKWVCTSTGISKFDNFTWTFYDSSNVPFQSEIELSTSIYIDSFNNKFIGTLGKGLLIYNENGITNTDNNNISDKPLFSLSGYFQNKIFNAKISSLLSGTINFKIVDLIGRVIHNSEIIGFNNKQIEIPIDFSTFSQGIYFSTISLLNYKATLVIIFIN